MGAAHGLRRGRRPRREQQHPEVVDVGGGGAVLLGVHAEVRPRGLERPFERVAQGRRVVAVGEPVGDEDATGQVDAGERRVEQGLVAWFGDDELEVRVRDVAAQMLADPGVVEPGHHRARQDRATQREDVVGCVVQQDAEVRWPAGVEPGAVEGSKARRLVEELPVGPDAVAEAERGKAAMFLGVVPQERCGVGGRERHLGQRRREGCDRIDGQPFGHVLILRRRPPPAGPGV